MALSIEENKIIRIEKTLNLLDIAEALEKLLYIPNKELKKKVIASLLTNYAKRINNPDDKAWIFITYQSLTPTGIVIYNLNNEGRKADMEFATFSCYYRDNFESFKELIDACELYLDAFESKKI